MDVLTCNECGGAGEQRIRVGRRKRVVPCGECGGRGQLPANLRAGCGWRIGVGARVTVRGLPYVTAAGDDAETARVSGRVERVRFNGAGAAVIDVRNAHTGGLHTFPPERCRVQGGRTKAESELEGAAERGMALR